MLTSVQVPVPWSFCPLSSSASNIFTYADTDTHIYTCNIYICIYLNICICSHPCRSPCPGAYTYICTYNIDICIFIYTYAHIRAGPRALEHIHIYVHIIYISVYLYI